MGTLTFKGQLEKRVTGPYRAGKIYAFELSNCHHNESLLIVVSREQIVLGKFVYKANDSGNALIEVPASELAPGSYTFTVQYADGHYDQKEFKVG